MDASRTDIVEVPPMFKVEANPWIKVPLTIKAVFTVMVPEEVYAPEIVVEAMEVRVAPPIVLVLPLKVCKPVDEVKVVALFTRLPAKFITAAAVSFQVLPAFKVTSPVKVFVPVADEMAKIPLAPAPTVVVPETVNANASAVKVVPLPTLRFPPIVKAAVVV